MYELASAATAPSPDFRNAFLIKVIPIPSGLASGFGNLKVSNSGVGQLPFINLVV